MGKSSLEASSMVLLNKRETELFGKIKSMKKTDVFSLVLVMNDLNVKPCGGGERNEEVMDTDLNVKRRKRNLIHAQLSRARKKAKKRPGS